MVDPMTGRPVLHDQYSDDARLVARQRLWQHWTGPSLHDTVLDLAALTGTERVADVGCGNGRYLAELRRRGHTGPILGFDLSPGMVRVAGGTAVADAQALPLRDGAVDVALSLHMLYHVPDIPLAIRELRRAVRPGGRVLVVTNGAGHVGEAKRLFAEAAATDDVLGWDAGRFDVDTARTLLSAVFDDVDVHDAGGPVAITDPTVLSGYIASWPPESIGLTAGPQWNAVLAEMDRLVAVHFAAHREFTVTSRTAVLTCR